MSPLVSVIVPVYNAEKYLEECLNSILYQTIQNWECIIVNDGSTDNSLSIIKQFVNQDGRFSYMTISNSGSAKTPRDTGISLAKSDWIVAVDADDYIDIDTLEKLLNRQKETGSDIIYLRMYFFDDGNPNKITHTIPAKDFDMKQVIKGKDAVILTLKTWTIGASSLIKRSLYERLSTYQKFLKNTYNTDEYDTRELMINADVIAFSDTVYYYRQHSSGITKKFSMKWFDSLGTDKMLEKLIKKHFDSNSIQIKHVQEQRMGGIIGKLYNLYKFGSFLSQIEKVKIKKMIKEHFYDLDKTNVYQNNKIYRMLLTKKYALFIMCIYFYYLLKRLKQRFISK